MDYPAIPPSTKLTCLGIAPGGGTRGRIWTGDWAGGWTGWLLTSEDIVVAVADIDYLSYVYLFLDLFSLAICIIFKGHQSILTREMMKRGDIRPKRRHGGVRCHVTMQCSR